MNDLHKEILTIVMGMLLVFTLITIGFTKCTKELNKIHNTSINK